MQEKEALVAIFDHNGKFVGSKKRRDIDPSKDILKAAYIILFNEYNEIYLTKSTGDLWRGKWGGSATSLARKDEDINETAKRTIERELGFTTKLTLVGEKYYDFNGVKRIVCTFVGRSDRGTPIPNQEDITEAKWYELPDVQALTKTDESMPTLKASIEMLNITA